MCWRTRKRCCRDRRVHRSPRRARRTAACLHTVDRDPIDGSPAVRFYLGTHEISWLHLLNDVPLFISHRRLKRQGSWRRATTNWALDSGGFTEVGQFGGWQTSVRDYVAAVRRYDREIGMMEWASPQDWMCEPSVLRKTGLGVEDHQKLTVRNYLDLMELDDSLGFIPVLQGFSTDDYFRCADMYARESVDLASLPLVGVGSVCRRQGTPEITDLFYRLSGLGLQLHGYGVKALGLRDGAQYLASADSLAWSRNGRWNGRGSNRASVSCTHKNCGNCMQWALKWRDNLLNGILS